ncbi:DUF6348 family protein [Actinoplanes sp. NPDC026623]|uniref:DUF6348 family protein n=1 Tax=Actinoplanes sp. NPDC026623 TaxID=3155610 RepID=UPI0033C52D1A
MFWKRAKPPEHEPEPERPSDDRFMALVRDRIEEIAPGFAEGSTIKNGILLGRHQPWAVMMMPNHTGDPGHFDLGFTTNLGDPGRDLVVDCVSGIGTGAGAVGTAVHLWAETSGACFLEMATGSTGQYATHLGEEDTAAVPGWHTISSGVIGYGPDNASNHALQAAMLDSELLRTLSGELTPALNRPRLNGIKVFLCRTPDSTVAEIRINGEPAVSASEAMAGLPWPGVADTAMARFYAVAARPG